MATTTRKNVGQTLLFFGPVLGVSNLAYVGYTFHSLGAPDTLFSGLELSAGNFLVGFVAMSCFLGGKALLKPYRAVS